MGRKIKCPLWNLNAVVKKKEIGQIRSSSMSDNEVMASRNITKVVFACSCVCVCGSGKGGMGDYAPVCQWLKDFK